MYVQCTYRFCMPIALRSFTTCSYIDNYLECVASYYITVPYRYLHGIHVTVHDCRSCDAWYQHTVMHDNYFVNRYI